MSTDSQSRKLQDDELTSLIEQAIERLRKVLDDAGRLGNVRDMEEKRLQILVRVQAAHKLRDDRLRDELLRHALSWENPSFELDDFSWIFGDARSSESDNDDVRSPSSSLPMPTAPANSDDALWALRAWGQRYDHPELREHIGKWVAIYGFRVILSGDDKDEVTRQAVEICGVPESRITVDFWEE